MTRPVDDLQGPRYVEGCADLWPSGRVFFFFHTHRSFVVVEIEIAETDRLDWALKQFRRRMIRSGLFKDMRRKRFYEKPSEARKVKAKAALRRKAKDRRRAQRAAQF
jgi:small subunit ribosomal protein S21